MKSLTETIVSALRRLANDIQSEDGVANACIAEAADRLQEYDEQRDAECRSLEEEREAIQVERAAHAFIEQNNAATKAKLRELRLAAKDAVDAMEESVATISGVSEHISDRFVRDSLAMAKTDLKQALDSLDDQL